MSEDSSALLSRLQQLQCHFTWDLKLDVSPKKLITRTEIDIEFHQSPYKGAGCFYSLLAYFRYLQDQREEALKLLNQSEETIRESYGDESERRLIVTYGDMAWLKYHDGDFAQSQSYCQRVEDILVKYPTGSSGSLLPQVYGEQGWAYFKVSRSSISKAIDCFRKALEVQPHDVEWNTCYAVVLFCGEQWVLENLQEDEESQAIKQLRFALEINPNNAALQCSLGAKLAAYKKYEEAESLVKKALENDPDNPHIIRHSGKYLRERNRLDEAIVVFERGLKRGDQLPSFNYQLALCYKQKIIAERRRRFSNREEVRKWRRICISHLEESVKRKRPFVLAWAELALLCAEAGDMSRAEEAFQKCLETLPEVEEERDCQTIHQRCGDFLHYHKKNEAQAIAHYTKGLLIPLKKYNWRQCAKKLKQIADRRLAKNRGDGEALALLGQVARAEGDRKEAAEFYEKALNCDKDNEEYLSALCELRLELQGSSSD
ncbi:interferon-induced protein with tetratricopeptide repeats 1-like isoform X1 [Astatotilapia calliptera]|uniref:interferon-induced protein with tetratricopeptide repeats 1-like isoform X1 n=1 Tax=Astatotilapia calliptera TaxID=8154 RepID=UPI000E40B92D|nr:interferon-induced protein with tetratricopeptide repeats 1-like isoform X1 [Astatotilapia calliptera]